MNNETSPALQYWQSELATKGEATKQKYQEYFKEFLDFIHKNPDEDTRMSTKRPLYKRDCLFLEPL